jgi:hypothetical protein
LYGGLLSGITSKRKTAVFKRADGPRPSPRASTFLLYFEVENLDSPFTKILDMASEGRQKTGELDDYDRKQTSLMTLLKGLKTILFLLNF